MRGIKALSKRYRLEVGTQAMPACIEALSRDRLDYSSYCLNVLFMIRLEVNWLSTGFYDSVRNHDRGAVTATASQRNITLDCWLLLIYCDQTYSIRQTFQAMEFVLVGFEYRLTLPVF